jgi:tetratricopeptide (TPR) repeat protein
MREIIELDITWEDTLHLADDYFRMADILTHLKQYDECLANIEKAYQLIENSNVSSELKHTTYISYLFRLSRTMIKQRKFDKASEYLTELESEIPKLNDRNRTQGYYGLLGRLALEKGEYDKALGEFQRSSRQNPFIFLYTGEAYEKKGDIAKAIKYYKEAANFNRVGNMYFAMLRKDAQRKLEKLQSS